MLPTPFFYTPLTDFSWMIAPSIKIHPPGSLCAKIQAKYADCLEAYGAKGGRKQCAELFFDLCECSMSTFQFNRARAIRKERMKQYRQGKIPTPFPEHPPLDSYLYL